MNTAFKSQIAATRILYKAVIRLCGQENAHYITIQVIEHYKPMSWYSLSTVQVYNMVYKLKRKTI